MSKIVLSEEQRKAFSDLFNVNSRFMRTVMGVVNNAAWMTCLDAIDQIRKHPRYRQNIKGGTTPMRQFKRCFDMLKDYEKRLKYGQKFPFFHVGNFTKETRDTFADNFTDNDYYDLWAASGFTVYSENRAMVTSLQNKLRLAYLNHGDPQPDIMGWAAAAQCALDIASGCWLSGIFSCDTTEEQYRKYHLPIPNNYWRKFYKDFNLAEIADFWADCIRDLAPDSPVRLDDIRYTCWPEQETKIEVKTLTELEQKNVKIGFDQLEQVWTHEDALYGSRITTAKEYAEAFRTNGEMKKAAQYFADMRESLAREKRSRKLPLITPRKNA